MTTPPRAVTSSPWSPTSAFPSSARWSTAKCASTTSASSPATRGGKITASVHKPRHVAEKSPPVCTNRDEWFRTAQMREYVELFEDEFVVMPNHIHGIIWHTGRGTARRAPTIDPTIEQFGKPVPGSIPTIVRSYKSADRKSVV